MCTFIHPTQWSIAILPGKKIKEELKWIAQNFYDMCIYKNPLCYYYWVLWKNSQGFLKIRKKTLYGIRNRYGSSLFCPFSFSWGSSLLLLLLFIFCRCIVEFGYKALLGCIWDLFFSCFFSSFVIVYTSFEETMGISCPYCNVFSWYYYCRRAR